MDNTLAFPNSSSTGDPRDGVYCESGMYLRDYFAAKALSIAYREGERKDIIAARAYLIADAMLIERSKP
jgi:hypothetical protein